MLIVSTNLHIISLYNNHIIILRERAILLIKLFINLLICLWFYTVTRIDIFNGFTYNN